MTDIKYKTGEPVLVNGDFVLVEGAEEVRQHVEILLGLYRGEARSDQDAGLDKEIVFAAGVTEAEIAQHVAEVIRSAPGIVYVAQPSVTLDAATRTLTVAYEADYQASDLEARRRIADKISVEI